MDKKNEAAGKYRLRKIIALYDSLYAGFLLPIGKNLEYFFLYITLVPTIRHIHGLKEIGCGKGVAVAICLVKNGGPYVEQFIKYYSSLGVKHIFFLDNGSTDGTLALIKKYKNTTILTCNANLSGYKKETFLKGYMAKRFCRNCWCLCADMDEFFDYPFSGKISLEKLLEYLNANSYNAVITQMLDMFSDKPLDNPGNGPLKKTYQYYDITNIRKEDYRT
ncbi:MAG: glycosyltransferase family 2 protein, partial [Elusimicrobia bacterium]|nr:glycosyltransferase family 2 protein [Elusimicrobiota bacterium]